MEEITTEELLMWIVLRKKLDMENKALNRLVKSARLDLNPSIQESEDWYIQAKKEIKKMQKELRRLQKLFNAIDRKI